jgi:hypothetical protein
MGWLHETHLFQFSDAQPLTLRFPYFHVFINFIILRRSHARDRTSGLRSRARRFSVPKQARSSDGKSYIDGKRALSRDQETESFPDGWANGLMRKWPTEASSGITRVQHGR